MAAPTKKSSRMLLEVGTADKAVERVHEMLSKDVKIPGFGHRVYRTDDPRATHLRVMSEELGKSTGHEDLYLMSKRVEETVQRREEAQSQRGFLFGIHLLLARHSDRSVHPDLRCKPHGRLDGPHARAIPQQSPDSAPRRIQRKPGRHAVGAHEREINARDIYSGRTSLLFGIADQKACNSELPFLPDAGDVRAQLSSCARRRTGSPEAPTNAIARSSPKRKATCCWWIPRRCARIRAAANGSTFRALKPSPLCRFTLD